MTVALSVALFLVFCVTIWLSYRQINRGIPPFLAFVGAYYFVFFGLLSWFAANHVHHLPYDDFVSAEAAIYIVAFVVIQIAGYAVVSRLVQPRQAEPRDVSVAPLLVAAWGGIGLTFLFHFAPVLLTLPSVPQIRQPCWYFSLAG